MVNYVNGRRTALLQVQLCVVTILSGFAAF